MAEEDSTAPLPDEDPASGDAPTPGGKVGRFLILGGLGSGGMGVVLCAYDPDLDRKVAVKLLRTDRWGAREDGQARLQQEAQAMARVSHPNVATVYEVGTVGDKVFVAMEMVEGVTLAEWLRQKRSWREIIAMFLAAGRGLLAVHQAQLVHRDFKPDNVLVGSDGRPRVSDFGLVSLGASLAGELSGPETLSHGGTPGYMSPEQARGEATDARSDQFSYCVALYRALYDQMPFPDGPAERPAPPKRGEVPARIFEIVARGLSPAREARFPSMGALLEALERDPAATRRRWGTRAAVLLAALGLLAEVVHFRSTMCGGAAARLAGVWDEARRTAVHAAFAATSLPFAEDSFRRVREGLDRYAQGWVDMNESACRETRVAGRQSDRLMDLRIACLERERATLGALTTLWSQGVEEKALTHAIDAVGRLPPLSDCADTRALTEQSPLPRDAVKMRQIAAARSHLDRVRALIAAERWPEAKTEASAASGEADATGWAEVRAEAAMLLGRVLSRLAEPSAEATLMDAASRAEAAHDDRLGARALLTLVGKLANGEQPDRALMMARLAEGSVERAGGGDELSGMLELMRGEALMAQASFAEARPHLLEGQRLLTRALGPNDSQVSDAIQLLARIADWKGDYREARRLLEDELQRSQGVFGPTHPRISTTLNNLAVVLDDAGDYAGAIADYQRILANDEKSFGKDSVPVSITLGNLAASELSLGRYLDAGRDWERAAAIQEAKLDPDLGTTLSDLSGVRLHEGRLDEALALAERGRAISEKALGPKHPIVSFVYVSLGDVLLLKGQLEEAAGYYQRAFEIRKSALGPAAPETLLAQSNLGTTRCRQKRYAEALPLLQESSVAIEKALGPNRSNVARLAADLGRCLVDAGQAAAALPILKNALKTSLAAGDPAATTAAIRFTEARARWASGDHAAAREEARAAAEILSGSTDSLARADTADTRAWLKRH